MRAGVSKDALLGMDATGEQPSSDVQKAAEPGRACRRAASTSQQTSEGLTEAEADRLCSLLCEVQRVLLVRDAERLLL